MGLLLALALLAGCAQNAEGSLPPSGATLPQADASGADVPGAAPKGALPEFTVDAETFALSFRLDGKEIPVSLPGKARRAEGFRQDASGAQWSYPQEQITVSVTPHEGFLDVSIRSQTKQDNTFQWPLVEGDVYYLPLGEGKRVPKQDPVWLDYLGGEQAGAMERLSMPFWAAATGEHAVVCILENPFRSTLDFSEGDTLRFGHTHEYPEIDSNKENNIRVYLTENDPVKVAKIYRAYVTEQKKFVSLAEKAAQNPNITKLYGAPFIYLFDNHVLTPQDIRWPAFREALSRGGLEVLIQRMGKTESGPEAVKAMEKIAGQDYVDNYQKSLICRALSAAVQLPDFYTPEAFPRTDAEMERLLKKGGLNEFEQVQLSKHALAANFPDLLEPMDGWAAAATTGLIQELGAAGLDRAWIGLNDWRQAYAKPQLVTAAEKAGYLIAAYDSYHSIHQPGKEQWSTAKFPDTTLYENATVANREGKKLSGFQSVGRKLNPTLAMPAVEQRMGEILSGGPAFNSWFIDCDATGEIYDDYSPAHPTTQQQDIAARLQRMSYIRDDKKLVIGSEGGNDFAAATIAYAHGIELQSFSWMDADMKNADSEYYIGRWYSPTGGVPEHFANPIPIKEKYYDIFLNPRYDVPLYKLVYNDSVITSYHWDWSTLRIKDHTEERMLRELLYNVPPLYHLDENEWKTYREAITAHTKVWSAFGREAVQREMADFQRLTEDGTVQATRYGDDFTVTANFGGQPYSGNGLTIPARSLVIASGGKTTVYTPAA